jgi:hypothetical protein
MEQLGYKDEIDKLGGVAKILYDTISVWRQPGRLFHREVVWRAIDDWLYQEQGFFWSNPQVRQQRRDNCFTLKEFNHLTKIGGTIWEKQRQALRWSANKQRAEENKPLYEELKQVSSQRAGQRREARKVRAAQEQAQASRSAVEVSDATLRAIEASARALELAATEAAAGQGSSGRRARTPPPVRTAEEEAAEEAALEAAQKEEAARLRNEKAEAKQKEQEEWLAKQRANKKGKGKGKAKAPAAASTERAPSRPRMDRERAAREALEDGPRANQRNQ